MIPISVIKPFAGKLIIAISACMFLGLGQSYGQSTIELLGADVIEYDQEFVDAERVKGNVRFKQDQVLMNCDSAYFYRKDNRIEA